MTVVKRGSRWAVVGVGGGDCTALLFSTNAEAWKWIDGLEPTREYDCAGRHEWSFMRWANGE